MLRFFFIIFFIFKSSLSVAQTNIAYLDLEYILNNSMAGKMITNHFKNLENIKKNEFDLTLEEIKKEENKIKSKKNIITDQEYNKQFQLLKKKINNFKNNQNKYLQNINKKKKEYYKKIFVKLNPIISEYAKENKISFIISKEYILLAKKEFDITPEILKLLNNELKSINFN